MRALTIQLRITHKIAAIGVVGMLGLAALVAIYLVGSHRQDQYLQSLAQVEKLLILSGDLNSGFLESRRVEKNFLLRGEMKYAERHAEVAKVIGVDLDSLENVAGSAKLAALAPLRRLCRGISPYNFTGAAPVSETISVVPRAQNLFICLRHFSLIVPSLMQCATTLSCNGPVVRSG